MELLQLRYFFESAKNESFAKTASEHMVPLTSVSASVRRLEKELGVELFDRHSNRITLNERGKKLQNSLFMILGELDSTISQLVEDHREIKIAVRVLRSEITDHIVNYAQLHPEISFKTIFDFDNNNNDDFDIVIDDTVQNYPDHKYFEYTSKEMKFRASSKNPLCGKKLHLKDLWNQKFITMGEKTSAHKMLVNACHREGFSPDIVVQTNDLLCYNKYIASGMGIALGRCEDHPGENSRFLDVEDFIGRQTVYVFYKSQMYHGNVKDFIEYIRSKKDEMGLSQ